MSWVKRVLRWGVGLLLALSLLACGMHVVQSQNVTLPARDDNVLRIASHNVHYIILGQTEGPWSVTGWEARKDALNARFRSLDADVVAFQEMESFQRGSDGSVNLARDFLADNNPGYGVAASADWRTFPGTQPIFYRKDRLELVDQGWFFFSDTPDVIYSRTFNGSFPAFASWVRLRDRAGEGSLRLLNLHFDASSLDNRKRSAALVAERLAPWILAGEDVVVLGDFNALPRSGILATVAAQGIAFLPSRGSTFHFNRGAHLFGAIDHIGHSVGLEPVGPAFVVQGAVDGVWPSDHYPVVADFVWP